MALSPPNPPGEELGRMRLRGRKFSAHHHSQWKALEQDFPFFFFNGDLHSPTSTPDSFETQICGKH